MSGIPADVDADAGPPMTVPLRHFVVALAFLVVGVTVGVVEGRAGHLAQVHLLLAGWVCLTIMGALTQFVPVWCGVDLYSRRLAAAQLPFAAAGFAGLAAGFLTATPTLLPVAGTLALVGVWTLCYNVGRTLLAAEPDVTAIHFGWALVFFVLVTGAGIVLALDHAVGVLPVLGISRQGFLLAHGTLAVFGAVLTTVAGALAQLAPMFTQADTGRIDAVVQRVETAVYPLGVLAFAGGRLIGAPVLARLGAVLVAVGLGVVAVLLARQLVGARVEWSPMLTRYSVAALSLFLWAGLTVVAWWNDPLAYAGLLGQPSTVLLIGGVGFVVFGTLYHVVPFIVWVHRYSDRLGFEDVPMVDDLYDHRIAAVDGVALTLAYGILVSNQWLETPNDTALVAGAFALFGTALFAGNLVAVLVEHSPHSLPVLLTGREHTPTEDS
ncbi:hypothetical protein Har1130_05450 [Haloarcula sp. CBA1130]|uniref:hypothetical protein n=1 Tax=unclassified Haloarcula TaxID=2624677 RepID=UPI0012467252|nr:MULTISPECIES: hypothetical protein [unclassified Haloarcula]KAA9398102.1 hypothetical protein Har1129_07690 [Haloarcula sp. CBA1129]KAA9402210.1 hypothetical protein Har1130_05450 [Haloarcula sp. CBA1130]